MGKLWSVHWVTDAPKVPVGRHPLLESWADLGDREDACGIRPGAPFMIDPVYRVDARLTQFFTRSSFAHLAAESKRSYTADYRVFFNFLWQRGKDWNDAAADDLLDFEDWRRRSPANPARVGGAKWNRELAALRRLYEWADKADHVPSSPVVLRTVRTRGGDLVQVAEAAASDVRSSNVKWLTPRTYRLWRDVGLRGYTVEGRRDPAWAGRHDDRNAAYADLLFCSGLRRAEAGSLLTVELPAVGAGRYTPAQLAGAVAKSRRPRTFYLTAVVLRAIEAYVATTRRAAIRRAQAQGRYAEMTGARVVTAHSGHSRRVLQWRDRRGQTGSAPLGRLGVQERRLLLVDGPGGLEPLWLWLSETGMPFAPHSWEAVFRAGSQRCATLLSTATPDPPFCTPHMCRHSFALYMLVALQRAMDRRFGLSAEERRDFRLLYGDPWRMVQDLLGHASEQITRSIYLAPVSDLQVRSLLLDGEEDEDSGDVAALLGRIAQASERVLDVEVGG